MNETYCSVDLIGYVSSQMKRFQTSTGTTVASFSMETNRAWKDKDTNETKKSRTFHRVSAFGELADNILSSAKERDFIFIRGTLKNKKTERGYVTEIEADTFLPMKKDSMLPRINRDLD